MTRDAPGPVLAIVGPTATGKTALAIRVARELGGEIISLDSRQVYRGLDVGTAKATLSERARAPHHGLDLLDPDGRYSAGDFARDARRWIVDIRARGRIPVLAGGTGFFLRALTDPIFREPAIDPERRRALREFLGRATPEELGRWVERLDPRRARVAAEGGPQRLVRTLEVALLTGRPLSWWHEHGPPEAPPVAAAVVVLTLPRERLYERIDRRAEAMWEAGLPAEVRRLRAAGYDEESRAMDAAGYPETLAYLRGEVSRDEAVGAMQRRSRRYARRQITWFRNQLPDDARALDASAAPGELVRACADAWEEKLREERRKRGDR